MKRHWMTTMMAAVAVIAAMIITGTAGAVGIYAVYDDGNGGNHKIVEHECGDHFEYPALTAWDACDGDLTDDIIVGGDLVLPDLVGEYVVTYNVFDSAGNAADEATRTILVIDTIPPIITVFGGNPVTIPLGEAYADGPVTAFDACDGDLTDRMAIHNPVDVYAPGEYVITYNVLDAAGNAAEEATRMVHVTDDMPHVGPLRDILLLEGMFYEWEGVVENESEVNAFQWYRHDGRNFMPIVDGTFGNGAFFGAETNVLHFAPFTAAMAGEYLLEVSDDKTAVQRTATVTVEKDSELPATGALGLMLAALATAVAGAVALKKRER